MRMGANTWRSNRMRHAPLFNGEPLESKVVAVVSLGRKANEGRSFDLVFYLNLSVLFESLFESNDKDIIVFYGLCG